ncbi:T9SS type A sorting domain-containing protein [Dyadobacter fanqingshengii]|uniref:T9SS type A sorting domain-containing protein n=1 Tax=Dyadobacter fanqingshengii TaxID=2906443 RepID=A0A9X1PBP6_9BACT|nr:T9SS type A sorting domain-containing protein [Dyadobacter fanqingshengii]MCF0040673.1 T9SS type A sorting domain-containing protein [Dyadobacter fanqingshengii]USJ37589.1 T9SS type A sorting domain-containing protein [Dyadobacter fanqingshengii]
MKKLYILFGALLPLCADAQCPVDIELTTQAEVSNFQATYTDCTNLPGDLTITGADIDDLSNLVTLTNVGGNLLINGNPLLENVTGLNNIVAVGGDLEITENEALVSLEALSNVAQVDGSLIIGDNDLLTDLAGLTSIHDIGVDLIIGANDLLTTLSPLVINSVGRDLQLGFNEALVNLAGLENISTVPGFVEIIGNITLVNLSGLNGLTSIGEDLYIDFNDNLVSLEGLENLKSIDSDLYMEENSSLVSLAGLEGLNTIGDDIEIDYHDALVDLKGFSGLTSVGGALILQNNFGLESLDGLEGITSFGEEILLSFNPFLQNLDGLSGVKSIGPLGFASFLCFSLTDITGLSALESIDGDMIIVGNSSLISLAGLEKLESIGDGTSLIIASNPQLEDMRALSGLTTVGTLIVDDNEVLTSLAGLNNLVTVTDSLSVSANALLENLDGLENLKTIGGSVTVIQNSLLASLSGLGKLESIGGAYLWISENPELEMCAIPPVCSYLSNETPELLDISANKLGCNSETEVLDACAALPVTLIGFEVKREHHTALLSWSTTVETNSDFFAVQHSSEGRNWQVIVTVKAKGESVSVQPYTFSHHAPVNGDNFYRLKMIDNDGSYAYSRIHSLHFANLPEIASIFPNPVFEKLFVQVAEGTAIEKVEIFDVLGKVSYLADFEQNKKTKSQLQIGHLPTGLYHVTLTDSNGKKETKKIIKK